MTDLGYIPPDPKSTSPGAMPVTIVGSDEADRKPQFPSLRLNGEQAQKAGLSKCAIGDVYEVAFHIKARRMGGDSWEMKGNDLPPAEFDVIAITEDPKEIEEGEEGEETDDESSEEKKPEPKTVKPKRKILSPRDIKGSDEAYDEEKD